MFRKTRIISGAMKALRETMDVVPADDPAYFPPPPVMRVTLAEMYEALRKQSHVREFEGMSIQRGASLLLLGLAVAFDLEPRPTMAAWCRAASERLGGHPDVQDKIQRDAAGTPVRIEPVVGSDAAVPASDEDIDAFLKRWTTLSTKWTALGEVIANDCLENGLREGGIVRYSEIKEYIESRHKYNTSAVEYGFTDRMLEFVKSGEVINLKVEGGDTVFVHKKYADELLNSTQSHLNV